MTLLDQVFFAFWFFLPAGLANMFPIFAAHTPGLRHLNFPLDFNLNFRGRRVFGENKTLRGLVVGVLVGGLTALFQGHGLVLGLLLGTGAILGDAAESFFKRQLDIPSGSSWFFFDQIDYILGGILLSFWYHPLSGEQYIYIAGVYFFLHLIVAAIGYLLGLKQKPI